MVDLNINELITNLGIPAFLMVMFAVISYRITDTANRNVDADFNYSDAMRTLSQSNRDLNMNLDKVTAELNQTRLELSEVKVLLNDCLEHRRNS